MLRSLFFATLCAAGLVRAQQPANDNFANAAPLTANGNIYTGTGTTVAATGEPGETSHGVAFAAQSSIWFRWTAPGNGAVVIDTIGSTPTASHALYTGTTLATLTKVAEDAASSNTLFEKRPVTVTAGITYFIAVGCRFDQNDRGPINLRLVFSTGVTITSQPSDRVASVGDPVSFTVGGTGPGIGYQWFRHGVALAGAITATLSLANVQISDGGSYHVAVSNPAGAVNSTTVVLRGANPPPSITAQPVNRLATAGEAVALTLTADGTGALQYQWRRNGLPLPGATAATLTFPRVSRSDTDLYDVRVNDGLSVTYSNRVRLDVQPAATPESVGLDPGFSVSLETEGGIVFRLRRSPDGKVLVAGNFPRYGGATKPNLARLNANGSADPAFVGATFDAAVNDVAVQPDGKSIVIGSFTQIDDLRRPNVARLNSDGTPDAGFTFAPSLTIRALSLVLLQTDGKILLAGDFTASAGGATRNNLIRLLPDGSLDATYTPNPNAAVRSLALQPDGKLLVAGQFTDIGGTARRYLTRLNPDGTNDPAFNPGTGPGGPTAVVKLAPDGRVLVSGAFSQFNGTAAPGLIRLQPDGTRDSTFVGTTATGSFSSSGVTPADNSITDLTLLADGRIVIVGSFQFMTGNFNASGSYGFARLKADGSPDSTFSTDLPIAGGVASVLPLDDDRVLIGGDLRRFTFSRPLGGVAAFSMATGKYDPAVRGTFVTGSVTALAPLAGGKILVGGMFSSVNGVARSSLARLNADGSLDPTFSAAPNDWIGSIAVQGDGRIVITGPFTEVGGVARIGIARLNADGSLDGSFHFRDVGIGGRGSGLRAVALAEGRVLIADPGLSSFIFNRRSFARLHADGSLDAGFAPFTGTTLAGSAYYASDFAVLPDERVLFSNDGTTSSNGIKPPVLGRVTRDGQPDPAFTPGVIAALGSGVRTVALLPDGNALIGGSFTTFNNSARNRIARLLPDGAIDPSFVPTVASTNAVTRLVPARDGAIYVFRGGAAFGSQAPQATALTRLTPALEQDASFAIAFTATSTAFPAVLLLDDGNLLLAGDRFTDGSVTRTGLVRTRALSGVFILAQPTATTIAAGAALNLSVAVNGVSGIAYQWFKDGAPIAGAINPSYLVPAAQPSATGSYFVRITHSRGTLDSNPAAVTVNESAPEFSLVNQTPLGFGSALQAGTRYALAAPVVRAGSAPLAYQWSRDGVPLPGETGTALFRAAWTVADSGIYRVTVSNSLGSVTSDPLRQAVADTPNWEWTTPTPQGNSLTLVSFANGTFFASGPRGTLLRSANGMAWTVQRVGGSSAIGPVVFGQGLYLALTQFGGVLTSPDGITWTARETGLTDGRTLSRIAFGGGRFVAAGSQGAVATSTDGLAWTIADLPVTDPSASVAFGNNRWLVVTSRGRVFSSADGTTWAPHADLPEASMHLAYGAGIFVAIGLNASAIYTSADGVAWARRASNVSQAAAILDLHYADGGFIASVGSSTGRYLVSTDGLAWREVASTTTLNTGTFTITRRNGLYVMAAAGPDFLRWSQDGLNWTPVGRIEGRSFRAIATNGTVAVAVGSNQLPIGPASSALLSISYDGTTWLDRLSGTGSILNDIAYGGAPANLFVAVGSNNLLLTSPDGANWNVRGVFTGQPLRGVKHVNGRFLAVGDNVMFTSINGATWSAVPLPPASSLYQTAYGAGAYIAVGGTGTILRSTDAVTWTARTSGATGTLLDVTFAAGKFVAVSSTGEIVTSPDGLTWTSRPSLATALLNVVFAGGRFLALGFSNGYYVSVDGETWTPAQHGGAQSFLDAIEFKQRLVAVGPFGSVLTQPLPAPAGATRPVVTSQPTAQSARSGQSLTLTAATTGTPAPAYQWIKDGAVLPGATNATLTLSPVQFADAGTYAVVVTNAAGPATTASAVNGESPGAQLSNLSVRTTLAAAQSLTVGFTIGGNGSSKQILVRAAGPALTALGVPGAMSDPKIELYRRTQKISENDSWSGLAGDFARVGAFPFPTGSRDAAVLGPLVDGTTVIATGTGPGAILVECYDTELASGRPERLINLSARNRVGPGADVLIAGFYLAGSGPQRLLIRGVGPALAGFGVSDPLADPKVEIFNAAGARVAENDNWPAGLAPEFARVGAFALPNSSRDAALVATLEAGQAYTVQVSGPGTTTGEALVEVYELP